ncbi:MAG TPA: sensor histidine kinase [Dysgonamonadaceae bacterium]|nr:sensor histidine kinase [Dysgonamonadaceae bacterium]
MSERKKYSQPFRPYARLMNIIGDQLITDKKVAVVEVLKNSYDADAENVQVRFFNFKNYGLGYLPENEQPYIDIEDDGDGMTLEIIEKVWLRPATPSKYEKKVHRQNKTKKGRIIQGEKGIGRFAIHKLGEKIELFTKSKGHNEVKLEMDFTEFNPEKVDLFNQPTDIEFKLLEQVDNTWYENPTPEVIKKEKGTLIRISHLREHWKENDLKQLYKSVQRLIPPVDENAEKLGVNFKQDFDITIEVDGKAFVAKEVTTFADVIERAQYTMIGHVTENGRLSFEYKSTTPQRSFQREVHLLDKTQLSYFNYNSYAIERGFDEKQSPVCGPFSFTFYAFDLSKPDKMIMNKDLKDFIKDNFVYVLRDGMRVYPYGEKGIDWLNLDKLRSTYRAGQFISYNDLTGFVYISQEKNSLLKDSTNRQGIMDINGAYEDFTALVTATTEIFNAETKIDKAKMELGRKKQLQDSNVQLEKSFNILRKSLEKVDDRIILDNANKFFKIVQNHTTTIRERMQTVEDLAGLGMAVEKASHDGLSLLSKMKGNVKDFIERVKKQEQDKEDLIKFLDELDENLNFIYDEMQILQPLFKMQRKSSKDISIIESIEKVRQYFRRDIKEKIDVQIIGDDDIIVKTNQGLILQVLINLLDNAVFWVNKNENSPKEIIFKIDSVNYLLYISDNGPGIREDVSSVVFNEFFSLKADGRGLGLYIVREILLRINAEIILIQDEEDKLLPGANFVVKFNKE